MEISPIVLLKMLLAAFLFGAQAGVVFDVGRAVRAGFFCEPKSKRIAKLYNVRIPLIRESLRRRKKKKRNRFFANALTFFFDAFFVFYSGYGLVKINYEYNDGDFRFFTVLAFCVGFLAYYFTLSRIIIFFLEALTLGIKYILSVFFAFFGKPFSIIYNYLVKKLEKLYEKFRIRLEKKRKKVYNICEIVCDDENGCKKRVKIRLQSRKKEVGKDVGNEEK